MTTEGAIKTFHADQAQELDTAMDESSISPDDAPYLTRLAEAGLDEGTVTKVIFSDELSGVSLTYVWFKKNFPLPRHRHNADCLYYIISGDLRLGTKILSAGDGFMVPADVVYSYLPGEHGVELLEFRTAANFDIQFRSSDMAWEKLISMVISNRDDWRVQEDPPVAKRIKEAGE